MTNSLALVPVFAGTINSHSVQLCDARTLHTFMVVLRDFSDWVKGRIRKFGFVEGIDFITVKNLSSPNLGSADLSSPNRVSSKARVQKLIDYHLTLDMAKELAMVENNAKGREARRYFIDCEKKTTTRPMLTYARISPAQAQSLKELVASVVATGKQGYPDTWARLQKKFRVNSYLELGADQFEDACAYLTAKLPDAPAHQPQTAINANDGPALKAARDVALRYFDDLRGAVKSGGNSAGMGQIPADALTGLVADALMRQRFLVTFDWCNGGMQVNPVPTDAIVCSAVQLPQMILQSDSPFSNDEVLQIAQHANMRMMGNVNRIKASSDIERLSKTVRTLGASDLNEIAQQAWLELSMRTTLTNELARV